MKFIYLDIELSGTRPFDSVIDIALVDDHGETLMDTLVSTPEQITPEMVAMTKINDAMVAKGTTIQHVHESLQSWTEAIWVSYHLSHDINWLNHSFQLENLSPLRPLGQLCLAKEFQHRHHLRYPISLDKALKHYSIAAPHRHRALPDAKLHRELHLHLQH